VNVGTQIGQFCAVDRLPTGRCKRPHRRPVSSQPGIMTIPDINDLSKANAHRLRYRHDRIPSVTCGLGCSHQPEQRPGAMDAATPQDSDQPATGRSYRAVGAAPETPQAEGTVGTSATDDAEHRRGDVGPSAAAAGDDLADLRRRLAVLEAQHALPLGRCMRGADGGGQFTPAYLGRALVAIEDHLAEMERFAALGDEGAARQSKLAATMRSCATLRMLCDDDDFIQMLIPMAVNVRELASTVPINFSETTILSTNVPSAFRDIEIQLLQVAGLPEFLARAHVDAAIAAYNENPTEALSRIQDPLIFVNELRLLRDASCQTADIISQGIRQQRSRQRWKKLLTFGLGGTMIVAVNGVGTAVLGPIGVAASGAIGSAAVGVAAQLLS
jgi:hypothetical protein